MSLNLDMIRAYHHNIWFNNILSVESNQLPKVHLTVTSPPYSECKDYKADDQIGYGQSFSEYRSSLKQVWKLCFDRLYDGRYLCVNIGQYYLSAQKYGAYSELPIAPYITIDCLELGFIYRGGIIWQKATTCNPSGGCAIMGSYPYPPNGIIKLDYEHILVFLKPISNEMAEYTEDQRERSKLTIEEWKEYFHGHWYFKGDRQDKYEACFPLELPRRLIRMYSLEGELVFDPFMGYGTTTAAAIKTKRRSLGIELRNIKDLILDRMKDIAQPGIEDSNDLDRFRINFIED